MQGGVTNCICILNSLFLINNSILNENRIMEIYFNQYQFDEVINEYAKRLIYTNSLTEWRYKQTKSGLGNQRGK